MITVSDEPESCANWTVVFVW